MASITPVLRGNDRGMMAHILRWFGALAILGPLAWSVSAEPPGFEVQQVSTRPEGRVLMLDATVDLRFSDEALDALDSGVPITVAYEIQVLRQRRYLWNDAIAKVRQRNRLQYHALTDRYVVINQNTGIARAYPRLEDAIAAIGVLRDLPLLDLNLLLPEERYVGEFHVYLDIGSLPTPLRPLAYLSSKWRLHSSAYQWPIELSAD